MLKKKKKIYNFTGCGLYLLGPRWEKLRYLVDFNFGKRLIKRGYGFKSLVFLEVELNDFIKLLNILFKRNDILKSKDIFLWKMVKKGKCINLDCENIDFLKKLEFNVFEKFIFFLKVYLGDIFFILNKFFLNLLFLLKKKC